MPLNKYDN